MKISAQTARKYIKQGRAQIVGKMSTGHVYPEGDEHWVINDNRAMRTLHVLASDAPRLDKSKP